MSRTKAYHLTARPQAGSTISKSHHAFSLKYTIVAMKKIMISRKKEFPGTQGVVLVGLAAQARRYAQGGD
jgi:hypothetical protein